MLIYSLTKLTYIISVILYKLKSSIAWRRTMEKNYRYAIRKTTLGVGSVAIAAFLAGQGQEV
ncbi:YSIRK-type signal peptide-containing protein, partial [Streptococcus anginosus]